MCEPTWGYTLWDQWDKILDHTKGGLEFTEKCHAFTRDRIKLEAEYVKNLRRLKRTYKLKNADDDSASYSTLKAFTVILDQIDLIAREHEMMSEKLSERVGDKLKQLHKDCTNTRKNLMHSANQMQTEYKEWQSSLERVYLPKGTGFDVMCEPTWGYTLWDQWDKILDHTKGGLEFTEKCHAFTRDRIKLEAEYVKNLRRLKRTYKLKNADDDSASYSTLKAFTVILDQIDLIAREHEMMSEKLSERVGDKLKQLHKDCTNTRKNLMHSANQMQTEYKEWQSSLERVR
eukprot:sb/3467684/